MIMKSPYETLNVNPATISPEIVKKAYKAAAAKAHPDRNQGDDSKMAEVNQARDILLNPERKDRFDKLGSTGTGPLTTEEQAILTLATIFEQILSSVPDYIAVSGVFAAIVQEVAKGYQKALEAKIGHPQRVRRARAVLKAVKCDPKLHLVLESRVEALEREAAVINQQVEMGNIMLKLLRTVKFK